MVKCIGRTISEGIAIGEIAVYDVKKEPVIQQKDDAYNKSVELTKFHHALSVVQQQLHELYSKALAVSGPKEAEIFSAHQMILEDEEYLNYVRLQLNEKNATARQAIENAGNRFALIFEAMDDEYMRARAADVEDVTQRMLDACEGKNNVFTCDKPVIVVADNLTPSQTIRMDRDNILAFVMKSCSAYSHVAILAKTMGIPAITGIEWDESWNHAMAIVDGIRGKLILAPTEEVQNEYREQLKEYQAKQREYQNLMQQRTEELVASKADSVNSASGMKIYANINTLSDVDNAVKNGAQGIGLFRSEFIYLSHATFPTQEEQFVIYKQVAEQMGDKPVIIRTMDLGADKTADYLNLIHEENPALGYRAIRICIDRPELLKTQLKAIYRAGVFGNLFVMYPMIISVDEIREIKRIRKEAQEELQQEGIAFAQIPEGIMIETPAAAIISDLLATEVDFFSIGTNDLTQYTLAIDRQNPMLDGFYDAHHEAVLRLIKIVADNAHREGITVGICGELAADATLLEDFMKMGIDELSVAPGMMLQLKRKLLVR